MDCRNKESVWSIFSEENQSVNMLTKAVVYCNNSNEKLVNEFLTNSGYKVAVMVTVVIFVYLIDFHLVIKQCG